MFVNTGCHPPCPSFMSPCFDAMFSIFGAACQVERLLSYHFSNAVSGREETDQRRRSPWDWVTVLIYSSLPPVICVCLNPCLILIFQRINGTRPVLLLNLIQMNTYLGICKVFERITIHFTHSGFFNIISSNSGFSIMRASIFAYVYKACFSANLGSGK